VLNLVVNHHVKLGLLHCMGLFDSKSVSDDEGVRGNPHPQSPTHSCETVLSWVALMMSSYGQLVIMVNHHFPVMGC
jgi:hypothetical protein